MGKKFNAHVAVHKSPGQTVWFAPGDDVPSWAAGLVGDHVLQGNESTEEDIRLTDPENEPDDPETQFSTPNTLPPTTPAVEDVAEDEYDEMTKAELKELAEERDLAVSGTKEELIARLREDDEEA